MVSISQNTINLTLQSAVVVFILRLIFDLNSLLIIKVVVLKNRFDSAQVSKLKDVSPQLVRVELANDPLFFFAVQNKLSSFPFSLFNTSSSECCNKVSHLAGGSQFYCD